jgi:hypothetical protein
LNFSCIYSFRNNNSFTFALNLRTSSLKALFDTIISELFFSNVLNPSFKSATSPKVIEESIDAAHAAWKKIQSEKRQLLQESVKKEVNKTPSSIVTESKKEVEKKESDVKQVISEEKEVAKKSIKSDQDLVDLYASVLK